MPASVPSNDLFGDTFGAIGLLPELRTDEEADDVVGDDAQGDAEDQADAVGRREEQAREPTEAADVREREHRHRDTEQRPARRDLPQEPQHREHDDQPEEHRVRVRAERARGEWEEERPRHGERRRGPEPARLETGGELERPDPHDHRREQRGPERALREADECHHRDGGRGRDRGREVATARRARRHQITRRFGIGLRGRAGRRPTRRAGRGRSRDHGRAARPRGVRRRRSAMSRSNVSSSSTTLASASAPTFIVLSLRSSPPKSASAQSDPSARKRGDEPGESQTSVSTSGASASVKIAGTAPVGGSVQCGSGSSPVGGSAREGVGRERLGRAWAVVGRHVRSRPARPVIVEAVRAHGQRRHRWRRRLGTAARCGSRSVPAGVRSRMGSSSSSGSASGPASDSPGGRARESNAACASSAPRIRTPSVGMRGRGSSSNRSLTCVSLRGSRLDPSPSARPLHPAKGSPPAVLGAVSPRGVPSPCCPASCRSHRSRRA